MWFKNIHLFQLLEPLGVDVEQFHDYLLEDESRHCGQLERITYGWTPPLGQGSEMMVHPTNNCFMCAARKEEKILPASVVREHVAERVLAIEAEQARQMSIREKRSITDEVTIELLPKALAKSATTYGYIDNHHHWLIIDTASRHKAEEYIVLLRKTLGTLKLVPPITAHSPGVQMTQWVASGEAPSGFTIDDYCEMRDPNAVQTVIRCVNQNLDTDEVRAHLATGKQVTQLAMTWQDRVSFVLDDELAVKRIRFTDLVQDAIKDTYAETKSEQFDADFAIFSGEFAALIPSIFESLGGLAEEEMQKAAMQGKSKLAEAIV